VRCPSAAHPRSMSAMNRPATAPNCAAQRHVGMHPLQMIPLFRRWPWSPARDLIFTFI